MTDNSTTGRVRYIAVSFDCADPPRLAAFYRDLLGLPVMYETDEFVALGRAGEPGVAFVRIPEYRPPTWPDGDVPKQAHFEFAVDDLDSAEADLVALGATVAAWQPQPDRWRVLLDPAGHPFCISTSM
ncbi:MAG TPA: VOC family protein [Micromonosporaceae bacterium]